MIGQQKCVQSTPSVYFNFQESNMKSDRCREYIPYQYSNSTYYPDIYSPDPNKIAITITPLIRKSVVHQEQNIQGGKVNTEEFFEEFDHNFVVKFEDDSPLKCEFSKHLDFNFGENDDDYEGQKENICKLISNISECNSFKKGKQNVNNQESAENKKQKVPKKGNKFPCEVRKRILFKNGQSLAHKGNTVKNPKIINDKNLMIVTSSNWSGVQLDRKSCKQTPFSQPIKSNNFKRMNQDNIFNTHTCFRQTLRSTTLDNWKKKHLFTKNRKYFSKNNKSHNIFEKPFSLLR